MWPVSASSRLRSTPEMWRSAWSTAIDAQRICAATSHQRTRASSTAAVAFVQRGARADAAGLLRVIAEAPALRAEPAEIGMRVGPQREFPVEHGGDAGLVQHDVAGAEVVVDQHGRHRRRRGAFQVPQAPFQHRARRALAVERGALVGDEGAAGIVRRRAEEGQVRARRRDGMDARQFAAQRAHAGLAPAAQRVAAHHAMPRGGAGDAPHDEEGRAEHGGVLAQEQRFGHRHAGREGGAQQRVFLRAPVADGERRRIVRPQHPGAPADDIQRPVLLDGAARQQRRAFDGQRRIAGRRRAASVASAAPHPCPAWPQRKKPSPSARRMFASTMRCTSDAPSTSRAWRA